MDHFYREERPDDGFEGDRARLLDEALKLAPFTGWTETMMREAGSAAGVAPGARAAAFPRGARDLLAYWSERADDAMALHIRGENAPKKVRDRVEAGLRARLAAIVDDKEAARRASATLALPPYAGLGGRLAWRTADRLWRAMDDPSTDFNFYTKRATLTAVWLSVFSRWLSDDEPGEEATRAFLKDRIENVMQFEKIKARARERAIDPRDVVGALSRWRYGATREDAGFAGEDAAAKPANPV